MLLYKDIKKNIDTIKKEFGNTPEIILRNLKKGKTKISYIYFESVGSDDKVSNFLMKSINKTDSKNMFTSIFDFLNNNIANSHLTITDSFDEIFYFLSSGFTCIFVDGYNQAIGVETKIVLDRGVTEANTEKVIRGPKDSFTENPAKNLGLIRKRIKDKNLWFEEVKVGRRTKSRVDIAYIKDIADNNNVKLIKEKLLKIDIDGILDSGYVRSLLEKKDLSSFPRCISTERPDIVCMALLKGKIAVLVENSPYVLIFPAVLMDFMHSSEDYYEKNLNVTFNRILRVLCFILTIIIPGLYVALMTFNHEIIPDKLLISLATQRDGVPFSTALEVIIFMTIFEMLREADIHVPSAAGNAMSIVGALILGDAAVAAGIVSPIVIIVVAITSICELVFFDIDVVNAVRQWRLLYVLAATALGLIGITAISIIFITKLASIESLGTPYLTPLSPLNFEGLKDSIIKLDLKKLKKRPSYLTNNIRRMNNEENNN